MRHFGLINGNSWTFGRSSDNDVQLEDRCASRNHAMIQMLGKGNYYLIDLGSRNGSFVNGRRVTTPVNLKNADHITLGDSNLDFYCPDLTKAITEDDTKDGGDNTDTDTVMLHRRRLITVVVLDIRNFTKLTQMLDEQILSELIGTWFAKAGKIITKHGSWVDKYIGDAVMAVWIHNTDPKIDKISSQEMLRAYRALYEIYQISNELNQQFALPFPLRVGAGMNTGFAMVGQMGTSQHPDYTALGDTVNAAFRLESATKEIGMDVAIGEQTYGQTPYAAVLLPFKQYQVKLKGYDAPTVTYAGTFEDMSNFLQKLHNMS
jgi:adenylate cyclase